MHFYRNVSTQVPHTKVREVMAMMKAIHAQENRAEAKKKAAFVVERLKQSKLTNAALLVADGIDGTLSYYGFLPNTGGASAPTTRSSASCERSAGAPRSSVRSPTATPH